MKILFIGNSYTFFNDMPSMFENLAHENGKDIVQHSVTKGGRKLFENLKEEDENSEKIRNLVSENEYDVLILQEQSCLPVIDYDKFLYGASEVKKLVGTKRTVLYSTWGRKSGSDKLEELGLTSEEMTEKLTNAYISVAKEIDAEISPVGMAFFKILKELPDVELYNKDLSHPSYIGTAVGTLCHYKTIYGEMPQKTDTLKVKSDTLKNIISLISESLNEK